MRRTRLQPVRVSVVAAAMCMSLWACRSGGASATDTARRRQLVQERIRNLLIDSIVLERLPCYGACPMYRVRLTSSGDVLFKSQAPEDSAQGEVRGRTVGSVADLRFYLTFGSFLDLPDTIARVRAYCPTDIADADTEIIRLFIGGWSKHVVNYRGCTWSPAIISQFARSIDSVGGVTRWLKPRRPLDRPGGPAH